MRSTTIATFLIGLTLCASGCRTRQHLTLLERENRDLEDALFQAQYDLEVSREQSQASRERQGPADRNERSVGPTIPERADDSPLDVEQLQPPSVELGPRSAPLDQLPEKFRLPQQSDPPGLPEAPPFEAPPAILPEPSLTPPDNGPTGGLKMHGEQSATLHNVPKLPLVDNNLVARVAIDPKYTGGLDADGNLGADGIVAAIQPRGEDGRLLRAAAPITIVVLDPALEGESARVARWDFTVDEVAQAYHRSSTAQGLQLKMLWPDKPPVNNRLHLFVRYTTGDGRSCESDNRIEVDLPGRPVQEWSATRPTDSKLHAASRDTNDWRRRQARIQPPAPVELPQKPLPVTKDPVRTASRPAERTAATPTMPTLAQPIRQPPVWSPNR